VRNEPEEQGKGDAQEQARDDRKVKRGVFAAVHEVAGQSSQAEGQLVPKIKKNTNQDEEPSHEDKRPAKFAERVHKIILPEPTDKP